MTAAEGSSCTCPLGPEDAHFPDCPWWVDGPICTPERRLNHGHTVACGPMGPEPDVEMHGNGIGEPNEHSTPPLPRLGEVLRDTERLIRCALVVLDRTVDPASMPQGSPGHLADALFETAGYHLEAAMRDLGAIAALPLPAVGSAVKLPVAAGKEPTPGSAVVLRGATSESQSPVAAGAEAGNTPDLPPGSGAPAALPVREVGLSLSELYKRHNSTGWPR
jgi:hypothetical protein